VNKRCLGPDNQSAAAATYGLMLAVPPLSGVWKLEIIGTVDVADVDVAIVVVALEDEPTFLGGFDG
jgi:hypothetical protein